MQRFDRVVVPFSYEQVLGSPLCLFTSVTNPLFSSNSLSLSRLGLDCLLFTKIVGDITQKYFLVLCSRELGPPGVLSLV